MPPSPLVKTTLAAAALSCVSNILAQFLDAYSHRRPFVFDRLHFLRFVVLALVTAPPNYKWQEFLERRFPAYGTKTLGTPADVENQRGGGEVEREKEKQDGDAAPPMKPRLNLRNTMVKWFLDCITLGAVVNTIAFFVLMGLLKGQTSAQVLRNIRAETVPLIVAGYKIWPFASIISFSCVPVEKRVVFLNFVGLLWGIYMSLVAARV